MLIAPQSLFILLRDVPLDTDYHHTIYFTSTQQQYAYFNSKTFKTYSQFYYVRHNEERANSVKIPEIADNVYGANYCMFQNAGMGTKWFYAFITDIEYVNNETTKITYEIDHWQTWLFEIEINECYVEREHVSDDTIGKNTVEENIPFGEYITAGGAIELDCGSGVMVQMAYETGGEVQSGVFSGLTLQGASVAGAGSIADLLTQFADQPEKVAMVTMTSGDMVQGSTVQSVTKSMGIQRSLTVGFRFNGDSYVPKNNKLYCYPYCLISLDNYNGNSEQYRWEDFNNGSGAISAVFIVHEAPLPKPSMECYPANYRGLTDAQNFGVMYDNFPLCPYVIDMYRAWASQAVPKMLISTGSQIVVGTLEGGITGGATALLGMSAQLANYGVENTYHQIHSTSYGGTVAGSGMNFDQNRVGFRLIDYTIKPEYARIIDDYFSRFGYKVLRYKRPNLKNRANFNYVKTLESNVSGKVSQETIDVIENSLNRGITLWHNTNVGNYEVKNEVVNNG